MDARGGKDWELAEEFLQESREPKYIIRKALELIELSKQAQPKCDDLLIRNAHHWELDRLALVDRNILRLATYELNLKTEPPGVIISEALKLAQEFSTSESPRFINGILDAICKEIIAGIKSPETTNTEE